MSYQILHSLFFLSDATAIGNMCERSIIRINCRCRSVIENASQLVESVLDEWMGRMDECKYWFDEESEVMSHILSLIISSNKVEKILYSLFILTTY